MAPKFVPHQIVYLEFQGSRLYAEVIQVLEERQMCWVRPFMLVGDGYLPPGSKSANEEAANGRGWGTENEPYLPLLPVNDGPDMLWPIHQFQIAVDTDVVPLLSALPDKPPGGASYADSAQALKQFINKLWKSHSPDVSSHF